MPYLADPQGYGKPLPEEEEPIIVEQGSSAPAVATAPIPPPPDTSMYAAPIQAQYQPGGTEYIPPYDDYIAQQYGTSIASDQPLAMGTAPPPTDPYNSAPSGTYPSDPIPAPPSYNFAAAEPYGGGGMIDPTTPYTPQAKQEAAKQRRFDPTRDEWLSHPVEQGGAPTLFHSDRIRSVGTWSNDERAATLRSLVTYLADPRTLAQDMNAMRGTAPAASAAAHNAVARERLPRPLQWLAGAQRTVSAPRIEPTGTVTGDTMWVHQPPTSAHLATDPNYLKHMQRTPEDVQPLSPVIARYLHWYADNVPDIPLDPSRYPEPMREHLVPVARPAPWPANDPYLPDDDPDRPRRA
jgi:hypothetical protein